MHPSQRTDECPKCLTRYNPPHRWEDDHKGGFTAYYVCQSCRHDWRCSWVHE